MLGWAVLFLLLTVVSAAFGYGGIAAIAVDKARILFFVFIVLFAMTMAFHLMQGREPLP